MRIELGISSLKNNIKISIFYVQTTTIFTLVNCALVIDNSKSYLALIKIDGLHGRILTKHRISCYNLNYERGERYGEFQI